MLGLINDILDLSKIESGKMELYIESFPVAGIIDEVAATTQTLVEKNGNTLELQSEGDLGEMNTDQTKLRQVLLNLVSNAAKFTEDGSITLTTQRETRDDQDWLSFR